jgi:hypothetical protein
MFGLGRNKLKNKKLTLRLLWDLLMVWVALINLTLICFDLTYLPLRPTYFRFTPIVTTVYDRVHGIEPHPLTSRLIAEVDTTEQLLRLDPDSPKLEEHLARLRALTTRVLVENPFDRSGQTRQLEIIRLVVGRQTNHLTGELRDPAAARIAAEEFWTGSRQLLSLRFDLFNQRIRPGLALNYHREFNLSGRLTDYFWLIDLPFLMLFWIEFVVRWFLAVRRRTHARWFFFPIFNWYDVLGLIPLAAFRPFRLLRAVSMYMRLRRSELSRIGEDTASRTVAYISNIITEEVSDRVALRILSEFEEEIQDGTHRRIVHSTIGSRREEIENVLVGQIRSLLTDEVITASFKELLKVNLETAVEETETLRSVPLPSTVLKPIVTTVGQIVLNATLETLKATLESEEGRDAVQATASAVLDRLFEGPGLEEIESLTKDISLHVIEHLKETVATKKWALPESPQKAPSSLQEAADAIAVLEVPED